MLEFSFVKSNAPPAKETIPLKNVNKRIYDNSVMLVIIRTIDYNFKEYGYT